VGQYVSVKIPATLADVIDRHASRFGYRSRSEFVIDAVREKLLALGFLPGKPVRPRSGPGGADLGSPASRLGQEGPRGSAGRGLTGTGGESHEES